MYGAAQRDLDWWDRIRKTKWAPRIAATWMALVTTVGAAGGVPALLPGEDPPPPPAIEQTVIDDSDTDVTIHVDTSRDDDPVEGVIVDGDDQQPPGS